MSTKNKSSSANSKNFKRNCDNASSNASARNNSVNNQSNYSKESKSVDSAENLPPLEVRFIEDDLKTGAINKYPALSKRFADSFPCVQFYLPSFESLHNSSQISEWIDSMEIYRKDLIWLLKLPYHKFWSFLMYSKSTAEPLLSSFLLRAVRPNDEHYEDYENNEIMWPMFTEIYSLVFRIFMRISVCKESRSDHITPSKWGSILVENNILDISKILDLCSLYDTEEEADEILTKMLDNLFKNEPRFLEQFYDAVKLLVLKLVEPEQQFGDGIRQMALAEFIDEHFLYDLLNFQIDSVASLHSFIKHYPPAVRSLHEFPQFELRLATSYESMVQLFAGVSNLASSTRLQERLAVYRRLVLQIYRKVLVESTIFCETDSSSNAKKPDVDTFFACLTACVDEKIFMYDYTKAYSFSRDIAELSGRGITVDETRIDYLVNAMSECWHYFGESGPDVKLKSRNNGASRDRNRDGEKQLKSKPLDPLHDPDFDRQLLGACSLDITGVELASLVTQIKDLFDYLPSRYIEACLKHYAYSTETVINAVLESSAPAHLDKYKLDDDDSIPAPAVPASVGSADTAIDDGETFHKGKHSYGFKSEKDFLDSNKSDLKNKIYQSLSLAEEEKQASFPSVNGKDGSNSMIDARSYIDEALLPTFNQVYEYEDEYDDTYDDVAVGSTEPDSWMYNPLNVKAEELETDNGNGNKHKSDSDSEEVSQRGDFQRKQFENFVEDPALVRERMERKRSEKNSQRKNFVPEKTRDVVGKPKGQGQDKDVVQNRKFKETHANQNRRRGADRKRREF